jgi:hypothetical protein
MMERRLSPPTAGTLNGNPSAATSASFPDYLGGCLAALIHSGSSLVSSLRKRLTIAFTSTLLLDGLRCGARVSQNQLFSTFWIILLLI